MAETKRPSRRRTGAAPPRRSRATDRRRSRRRRRAHGNLFTAHLLTGARDAAEMHFARADRRGELSGGRARVAAGGEPATRGNASDGVSEEAKEAYERAAALAREAKAETIVAAAERGMR